MFLLLPVQLYLQSFGWLTVMGLAFQVGSGERQLAGTRCLVGWLPGPAWPLARLQPLIHHLALLARRY